ncbi:hypothetical protein AUK11_03390 [bacterium CG2_30_37_16]|nr:MAG: hypothetical protein AUK11_03390 [bacterium CG2_30_37_16]
MPNNPFNTIKDFVQGNEKVKKAMEVFEKAQKKYEESVASMSYTTKSKPKGSNSVSTKGNYNVYVSGTGRGY